MLKILAILLSLSSAHAQVGTAKTVTALNAEVPANIATNTSNQITPALLNQVLLDIIASYANLKGDASGTVNLQVNGNVAVSSQNYVSLQGATTGNAPSISATGGDANIGLVLSAKGTNALVLAGDGQNAFSAGNFSSSAVNYLSVFGGPTGQGPQLNAAGTDANISISIATKGTGSTLVANFGHFGATVATAPTAVACTGFTLGTGSSDLAGRVAFNSATNCTIQFGSVFNSAPFCVVAPGSTASTVLATTTTTAASFTFGTANTALFYHCMGS